MKDNLVKPGGESQSSGEVTTPEPQLLPCPFCGGDSVVATWEGDSAYVNCWGCGAAGPYASGENGTYADEIAIAAWNRRHSPLAVDSPELSQNKD